ncbi:MAG: hypothetical protein AAGI38_00310, partial [Bacteroidota bacterium]
ESTKFCDPMFESFLFRYPSVAEEEASINMVDGLTSVVLNQQGNSKEDFIDIFLSSNDYYEGEVVNIYRDFLLRDPDSQEMSEAAVMYRENKDYRELLKEILSKDEYLGI